MGLWARVWVLLDLVFCCNHSGFSCPIYALSWWLNVFLDQEIEHQKWTSEFFFDPSRFPLKKPTYNFFMDKTGFGLKVGRFFFFFRGTLKRRLGFRGSFFRGVDFICPVVRFVILALLRQLTEPVYVFLRILWLHEGMGWLFSEDVVFFFFFSRRSSGCAW